MNHRSDLDSIGNDLRLGVIGFGKLGILHAALSNSVPGCKLVALSDNSPKILSIFQSLKPEIKCFQDHKKMLDEVKLDAVIVATPTFLHPSIALDVLEKSIPILIEKPLAINPVDAKPLLKVISDPKCPTHMVGYMNRHNEAFRYAYDVVQSRALGKLYNFRATMYISQVMQSGKGWRFEKERSGGGVLITQNCHLLDTLVWTFGNVEWVSAHTQKIHSENVEDVLHCYLSFKNGMKGWIDASWSQRHHRTLTTSVDVQGENGTLSFNDDEVNLYLDSATGNFVAGWTRKQKPDLFEGVSFDIGGPHYTKQMEKFIHAVRHNKKVDSDIHSAYRVQCLVDAIYQSAESKGANIAVEFS